MKINTIKLIYFSPTRTTRKVLEGIATGIEPECVEHLDLTLSSEGQSDKAGRVDLVLFGAPVYAGRIPKIAADRILRVSAANTPAVIVAVYGNRAYEDALVELKELSEKAGCKPIAAAAFIGEHSFSSEKMPIALHRPDEEDMMAAGDFGRRIREKLDAARDLDSMPPLSVPGNHPYKERHAMPAGSPTTRETLCTLCGGCADVCPVDAIAVGDHVETDVTRCIYCCACIKICPTNAREMMVPKINEIAGWLNEKCADRKVPEYFI